MPIFFIRDFASRIFSSFSLFLGGNILGSMIITNLVSCQVTALMAILELPNLLKQRLPLSRCVTGFIMVGNDVYHPTNLAASRNARMYRRTKLRICCSRNEFVNCAM